MHIPDRMQTEREALVKAQADVEHFAEAQRRATAAAEYEQAAPLAERRGPLPERLATLAYLPPEDQQLYAKDMDGSFVLAYIRINDEHSVSAYTDRIGRGISVLGEDETPITRRAQEHRRREMEAKVHAILADTARKEAEAKLAAEEDRLRKEQAKIDAERERIRRQAMPGGMDRTSY